MSRIADLGVKNSNLPSLLEAYDAELGDALAARLSIRGKNLDEAFKEQCSWPIYYDVRKAELKTLVKYLTAQVDKVRGQLAKRYTENYSRQLGERVMNSYIDQEEDYIRAHELQLEVEELYEQYACVADAFKTRSFALRDLTAAKIEQIHNLPI